MKDVKEEQEIKTIQSDIENSKSIPYKKEQCYKQQKMISKILNIYQHRLLQKPKRNNNKSVSPRNTYLNGKTPSTTKNTFYKQSSSSQFFPKLTSTKSTTLYVDSKHKTPRNKIRLNASQTGNYFYPRRLNLIEQKESLFEHKRMFEEKRKEEGRQHWEQMNLLRNNFRIFNDHVIFENQNKRNVMKSEKKIGKENIAWFFQNRKQLVDSLNSFDIERLTEINNRKLKEIQFIKSQLEMRNKGGEVRIQKRNRTGLIKSKSQGWLHNTEVNKNKGKTH